jgi:tetratricopeptide (TPR) repeat protein
MPLSGLSIGAFADHVVVREGANRWLAESGQYLLSFEGDPERGTLRVIEPAPQSSGEAEVSRLSAQGAALERSNAEHALIAYERAIASDASRLDARINFGRLLHELERYDDAEQAYRDALTIARSERNLSSRADLSLLHFNLGVLLDELERPDEAMGEYEAALRADANLADAHYNLALLHEERGEAREALRHMASYRRLVKEL